MSFNHFDEQGHAVMVDVSEKQPTMRLAIARAGVVLKPEILKAILDQKIAKGDVLSVARLAGISAAKNTPNLIPLSHPLAIHMVHIEFEPDMPAGLLEIRASVKAMERTGMEMEAMVAASVAALTVYDMCKGSDKSIAIENVWLLYKEGGKSGVYKRAVSEGEDK